MAEKTTIVGTDDKGQFAVPVPRSAIERVDIIDIDLVLQTKSGQRLILPGAAIEAMTDKPPSVMFRDGNSSASELLGVVERVETPPSSIPAMTSLTEFDQKKTAGKKNMTADDAQQQAAQQAQAQQVAPLPTQGNQSAVDQLVEKAEAMEADIRKKAFDPAPPQPYEPPPSGPDAPPGDPKTYKIPMYVSLAEANVVDTASTAISQTIGAVTYTKAFSGSGGPSGSAMSDGIQTTDALQYGIETLTGSAGNDIIYADGFTKSSGTWATTGSATLNPYATYAALDADTGRAPTGTAFYYAKEIQLNVAGYVRSASSITVSGLPDGVFIEGGSKNGDGTWTIPVGSVFPTSATLTLVYDVTKMHALGAADVPMSVRIVGYSSEAFDITRTFMLRFADVADASAITSAAPVYIAGSGWTDIYTMPTASAPHSIDAGEGHNLIYAGNSADSINAGAGDDTVYAYGGNDTLSVGDGNNLLWAGNGDDKITTGTGNDTIHLGNGANTVTDGGGINQIDSSADSGADVVTISAAGTNTITLGVANDGIADGNDTVTTGSGIDIIKVGDGDNRVSTGDGDKQVVAGTGNDTVVTGAGNDVIDVGGADSSAGSANRNIVWAGDGKNTITAGDGNDTLVGGAGIDSIGAGAGNDWIFGGAGNNNAANGGILDGGSGVDWLSFNGIANTVDASHPNGLVAGGSATLADWLSYAGTAVNGVSFTADASGSGTATRALETDTVANIENLIGSSGADTLDLSAYTGVSHTLYGLAGNDVLRGADGADILYGGAGNDSILGGAGNDLIFTAITSADTTAAATALAGTAEDSAAVGTLSVTTSAGGGAITFTGQTNVVDGGAGADTVIGGAGADYFIATQGESGDGSALDSFVGGLGTDTLDLSSYSTALSVAISEANGTVQEKGGTTYFANFAGIERVVTGAGGDSIIGSNADATSGWTGNDIIYSGQGNDTINAGTGIDIVYAGDGNDILYSEGGNDSLYGEAGNDTLYGYGGTTVLADTATITLDGGAGSNTYYLYGATEYVYGNSGGTDTVSYWNGYSRYGVTSGTALVDFSGTSTRIYFGIFANLSTTDYGVDSTGALVDGAASSYWRTGSATVGSEWQLMAAGTNGYQWQADNDQRGFYANAQGDRYYDVEHIVGTNYNDVLIGNDSDNSISGNNGNDALYGLGGNDYFSYGGGNTFIDGGANGSSVAMTASGVTGGDTLDMYSQSVGMTLTLLIDGGVATNTVSTGTNTITFRGIENFLSGSGDDVIYGTNDGNYIVANAGNDTVYTYGGDDVINLGQNRLGVSDVGTDSADAGTGTDWVSYLGIGSYNSALGVDIHLEAARSGAGADWTQYAKITYGASSYRYADLAGFENVQGSNYADTITGDGTANVLWGMGGNDTLTGGGGNDTLDGGSGADKMLGGSGNDVYYVENGSDTVTESAGEGIDTIYTTVSFTIAANVESLIGTGSSNISLTGTSSAETITGNDGNNVITGNGGADYLSGGAGNDTFSITASQALDVLLFDGGSGTDTVRAISFTLNDTFADAKWESIEAINIRNGGNVTTAALTYDKLSNILDVADGGTLTLYLDNGDTFTTDNSTVGAGTARSPSTTTTYDYSSGGNTLHVQVQWA